MSGKYSHSKHLDNMGGEIVMDNHDLTKVCYDLLERIKVLEAECCRHNPVDEWSGFGDYEKKVVSCSVCHKKIDRDSGLA